MDNNMDWDGNTVAQVAWPWNKLGPVAATERETCWCYRFCLSAAKADNEADQSVQLSAEDCLYLRHVTGRSGFDCRCLNNGLHVMLCWSLTKRWSCTIRRLGFSQVEVRATVVVDASFEQQQA